MSGRYRHADWRLHSGNVSTAVLDGLRGRQRFHHRTEVASLL
jgi:hypothetical protein